MPPLRCSWSGENLVKRTILPFFLIVLAALVAIPNLNIPPAKASGSPPWSFRDDFNYTSISQLQAAGWTTESIAPASYYSVGNSTLTLLNDGPGGGGAGYSNIPANVSDWSVSARVEWIGTSGPVSGYVGSLQVAVGTVGHFFDWMADGYYGKFWIGMDGHNVASFASYAKQLNVWHILQLDMIHGTLYGYFDGSLMGSYTELDTTSGNTNLLNIQALASWETNNNFDWMQANNSPTPPTISPFFTLSANPASVALLAGQSGNSTIQIGSQAGFAGTVSLTSTAASGGPSVQISPSMVTLSDGGSATAVLTLVSQTSTQAGAYQVAVTGTNGNVSRSVTLTVTVNSASSDFTILESPTSQAIPLGSEQQTVLDLDSVNGFSGNVTLVATPSSNAIACWFTYTLTSTATVYIPSGGSAYQYPPCGAYGAAGDSTVSGTYNVTITGSFACIGCYYDGTDSHSVTVSVEVSQPSQPDFYISANPSGLAVTPGSSATSTISLTSLAGFANTVNLVVSVTPNGPSALLNPASVSLTSGGTGTSTLTVSTASTTPTGSYTITVSATSGSLSHFITVTLSVSSSEFTISESPTSQAIPLGSEMQTDIYVSSVNGFSGYVNLVATPSSTAVACWFAYTLTNTAAVYVPSGGSAYQWPTCGAYGPAGSYSVTVTGTSDSLSYSIVLPVTVMDYSISASSVSFTAGSSGNSTVSLTSLSGLSGLVSVAVSTPSGLTASCSPNATLSPGGTSTGSCTFTAPAAGTYTVTVTGTFVCSGCYYDGTNSHSTTATVTVTSTDPPVSSKVNFQGTTVTTSGSLTINSGTVSGTVSVMATNRSSTVLFSKTYTITNVQITNNQARFVLDVPVSPYPLSVEVILSLNRGVWSASVVVTSRALVWSNGVLLAESIRL